VREARTGERSNYRWLVTNRKLSKAAGLGRYVAKKRNQATAEIFASAKNKKDKRLAALIFFKPA